MKEFVVRIFGNKDNVYYYTDKGNRGITLEQKNAKKFTQKIVAAVIKTQIENLRIERCIKDGYQDVTLDALFTDGAYVEEILRDVRQLQRKKGLRLSSMKDIVRTVNDGVREMSTVGETTHE